MSKTAVPGDLLPGLMHTSTARDLHDALDQLDCALAEQGKLAAMAPEAMAAILQMGVDVAQAAVDGVQKSLPSDVVAQVRRERNRQVTR